MRQLIADKNNPFEDLDNTDKVVIKIVVEVVVVILKGLAKILLKWCYWKEFNKEGAMAPSF